MSVNQPQPKGKEKIPVSSKDQIAQPPTDSVENILYDILGGYHLVLNGEVTHEPFYGTTHPESDLRPGERCDTDSKADFVNRAKWMFDKHIGATVEEAVTKALSTATSPGIEADTKPSSSTLEENITKLLSAKIIAHTPLGDTEILNAAPIAKALLSLYQKELVRELDSLKTKQYYAEGYGYDHGDVIDVSAIEERISKLTGEQP